MELLEPCKAMNHPCPAACRGKADPIGSQITRPASARPTSRTTRLDAPAAAFVIVASSLRYESFGYYPGFPF
jgi:hypothetical protein